VGGLKRGGDAYGENPKKEKRTEAEKRTVQRPSWSWENSPRSRKLGKREKGCSSSRGEGKKVVENNEERNPKKGKKDYERGASAEKSGNKKDGVIPAEVKKEGQP